MPGGYTQHIVIDRLGDGYAGVDAGVYRPDNYMLGGGGAAERTGTLQS